MRDFNQLQIKEEKLREIIATKVCIPSWWLYLEEFNSENERELFRTARCNSWRHHLVVYLIKSRSGQVLIAEVLISATLYMCQDKQIEAMDEERKKLEESVKVRSTSFNASRSYMMNMHELLSTLSSLSDYLRLDCTVPATVIKEPLSFAISWCFIFVEPRDRVVPAALGKRNDGKKGGQVSIT